MKASTLLGKIDPLTLAKSTASGRPPVAPSNVLTAAALQSRLVHHSSASLFPVAVLDSKFPSSSRTPSNKEKKVLQEQLDRRDVDLRRRKKTFLYQETAHTVSERQVQDLQHQLQITQASRCRKVAAQSHHCFNHAFFLFGVLAKG